MSRTKVAMKELSAIKEFLISDEKLVLGYWFLVKVFLLTVKMNSISTKNYNKELFNYS